MGGPIAGLLTSEIDIVDCVTEGAGGEGFVTLVGGDKTCPMPLLTATVDGGRCLPFGVLLELLTVFEVGMLVDAQHNRFGAGSVGLVLERCRLLSGGLRLTSIYKNI